MPEELDSKKKPKTTLIKHKKVEEEAPVVVEETAAGGSANGGAATVGAAAAGPAAAGAVAALDKKKVVVVKKKVVVVAKKTVHKQAPSAPEAAALNPRARGGPRGRCTSRPAHPHVQPARPGSPGSGPRPGLTRPPRAQRPLPRRPPHPGKRRNGRGFVAQERRPASAAVGARIRPARRCGSTAASPPAQSARSLERTQPKRWRRLWPPTARHAPAGGGPGKRRTLDGIRREEATGEEVLLQGKEEDRVPEAQARPARREVPASKEEDGHHGQPGAEGDCDRPEGITVADLAKKMNLKGSDLIHKLMAMGMMLTINQQIDSDTASLLAAEYDCKVNVVSLYDETVIEEEKEEDQDMQPRPPIVTIMGHVDHGKTKLLDAIRSANVAEGEYGGITQHIGAYCVDLPPTAEGKIQGRVVFLDTPGHEAFTMMRARGAQVTDIVVLVVSAVDGVMPQTIEAINHAKQAQVPIIVAVNKVDLAEANVELVKRQLSEHGLTPEEWGGTTIYNEVSALKKTGIKELLESILLQAEVLELKASYKTRASGIVLESRVEMGRGIVGTVILQKGTLSPGDSFVAGIYSGKVRAIFNDRGGKVTEATPSLPVEVIGFTSIPNAGDPFQVTDSEQTARNIGSKRQELRKQEESKGVKKVTLDNLYEQIKEGQIQGLNVIIKADVAGSVEALKSSLQKLSTSEVKLEVIHAAAGAINEGDVLLAATSNALIVGFHVRPSAVAQSLADREKVDIRKYNIIYDALEDIRSAMEGMLKPELREEQIGTVEVRNTFKIPKVGTISRLPGDLGEGPPQCRHPSHPGRRGDLQGQAHLPEEVQGRREGSGRGIRVRNRPGRVPRHQGRGQHRGVRDPGARQEAGGSRDAGNKAAPN